MNITHNPHGCNNAPTGADFTSHHSSRLVDTTESMSAYTDERSRLRQTRLFSPDPLSNQSPNRRETAGSKRPSSSSSFVTAPPAAGHSHPLPLSETASISSRTHFTRLSATMNAPAPARNRVDSMLHPSHRSSHRNRRSQNTHLQNQQQHLYSSSSSSSYPCSSHRVCAVSENLARETCITSLDVAAPHSTLTSCRQGNGLTYAETLQCLRILQPHEIILNEGRRQSPLTRKVLELFHPNHNINHSNNTNNHSDQNGFTGEYGTHDDDRENQPPFLFEWLHNATTTTPTTNHQHRKNRKRTRNGRRGLMVDDKHYPLHNPQQQHQQGKMVNSHKDAASDSVVVIRFVSRGLFDQTRGAALLRHLVRPEIYNISFVEEYILLSSAHAVLTYVQMTLGATLAPQTLHLTLQAGAAVHHHHNESNTNNDSLPGMHSDSSNPPPLPSSNYPVSYCSRMMLDRTTQYQLELLCNSKTGKPGPSLMATINKTKTPVGSRLLRTNLMAPPTHPDTMQSRYELVDAFLHSSDFFFAVFDQLDPLPDVDHMLSQLTWLPSPHHSNTVANLKDPSTGTSVHASRKGKDSPAVISEKLLRQASTGIAAIVSLKSVLSSIPHLASVLEAHLHLLDQDRNMMTAEDAGGNAASAAVAAAMQTDSSFTFDEGTIRSTLGIGLGATHQSTPATSTASQPFLPQQNHLLRAIVHVMKNPQLSTLLLLVQESLSESTTYSRNAHARQHQECFALKDDQENGFLSLLRRAYKQNVDDIYKAADDLAEKHHTTVSVRYSSAKGYSLTIPWTSLHEVEMPSDFLHPTKSGKFISFDTVHVASLNARARENVRDLLMTTHERIQEILDKAREPSTYDALASLCDAIALLDLCHGFADLVSLSLQTWCRPTISGSTNPNDSTERTLVIRNGRFPIAVEEIATMKNDNSNNTEDDGRVRREFVPNDTFLDESKTFTVITGVNGAGKSTYLKQIAIITILAHIGCYVPAEYASIPIYDRLCTRIGNADDQEHNISTFMLEMKETAFICTTATRKSLILLDELGRATSNEDGVAIAWAVSEYLLSRQSTVFFVTHYPQLAKLVDVYPHAVQNIHLEAIFEKGEQGNSLSYSHKVKPGSCSVSSEYGIELAMYCGWTLDVQQQARAYEERVRSLLPDQSFCHDHTTSARSLAYTHVTGLAQDLHQWKINDNSQNQSRDTILENLMKIQSNFLETIQNDPKVKMHVQKIIFPGMIAQPEENRLSMDKTQHDSARLPKSPDDDSACLPQSPHDDICESNSLVLSLCMDDTHVSKGESSSSSSSSSNNSSSSSSSSSRSSTSSSSSANSCSSSSNSSSGGSIKE